MKIERKCKVSEVFATPRDMHRPVGPPGQFARFAIDGAARDASPDLVLEIDAEMARNLCEAASGDLVGTLTIELKVPTHVVLAEVRKLEERLCELRRLVEAEGAGR